MMPHTITFPHLFPALLTAWAQDLLYYELMQMECAVSANHILKKMYEHVMHKTNEQNQIKRTDNHVLIISSDSVTYSFVPVKIISSSMKQTTGRNVMINTSQVWPCLCRNRQIARMGGEPNRNWRKKNEKNK